MGDHVNQYRVVDGQSEYGFHYAFFLVDCAVLRHTACAYYFYCVLLDLTLLTFSGMLLSKQAGRHTAVKLNDNKR